MRTPSRRMPKWGPKPMTARGWAVLLLIGLSIAAGFAYLVLLHPVAVGLIGSGMIALISTATWILNRAHGRQLAHLAAERQGESICSFARSFERRAVDTWIIRAAYEELQDTLANIHARFPIRHTDRLSEDLRIDPEDAEYDAVDIARRAGRDLRDSENSPYYGKVETVGDLVRFLNAQPRLVAAAHRRADVGRPREPSGKRSRRADLDLRVGPA